MTPKLAFLLMKLYAVVDPLEEMSIIQVMMEELNKPEYTIETYCHYSEKYNFSGNAKKIRLMTELSTRLSKPQN